MKNLRGWTHASLGPAAIAVAGAAMAWWSWGTWPDVLIDFGRELYVPWQITEGKVLYRDIAHLRGPLSSYWNALCFRLFGVGLRTMVLCNLALLAALAVVLYRVLVAASSRLAATVACLTFVGLFAFGQLTVCGNYNYVCPYAVEMTHGVLLSVAALGALARYLRRGRVLDVGLMGLALGLAFLTKAEPFLAGAVGVGVGLGFALWADGRGWRAALSTVGVLVGVAAVPVLVAFGLLCIAMPAGLAMHGVLGQWPYLVRPGLLELPLYQAGLGLDGAGAALGRMLMWTAGYAAVFGLPALLATAARRAGRWRVWVALLAFVVVGGALASRGQAIRWEDAARPLPLVMLGVGVALAVVFARQRHGREQARRTALRLALVAFAFTMLLKMLLNARLYHYGFALAMPAVLVLVVAACDWLPAAMQRLGGYPPIFLAAALAVWLVAMGTHLRVNASFFAKKTVRVGSGADGFLADDRGAYVCKALAEVLRRVSRGQTVAVLPDGVMLNYLSRRPNPTPYPDAMPLIVAMYGEENILEAYRAAPPDFVVLVHKDTSASGYRFFGRDYAKRLFAWIEASYRPAVTIGAPPLRDHRFGIQLLQRVPKGVR